MSASWQTNKMKLRRKKRCEEKSKENWRQKKILYFTFLEKNCWALWFSKGKTGKFYYVLSLFGLSILSVAFILSVTVCLCQCAYTGLCVCVCVQVYKCTSMNPAINFIYKMFFVSHIVNSRLPNSITAAPMFKFYENTLWTSVRLIIFKYTIRRGAREKVWKIHTQKHYYFIIFLVSSVLYLPFHSHQLNNNAQSVLFFPPPHSTLIIRIFVIIFSVVVGLVSFSFFFRTQTFLNHLTVFGTVNVNVNMYLFNVHAAWCAILRIVLFFKSKLMGASRKFKEIFSTPTY